MFHNDEKYKYIFLNKEKYFHCVFNDLFIFSLSFDSLDNIVLNDEFNSSYILLSSLILMLSSFPFLIGDNLKYETISNKIFIKYNPSLWVLL